MLQLIAARPGGETLEEIHELFALPLDEFTAARGEPGRARLREGRLTDEVELSGFGAFAGLEVSAGGRRAAKTGGDDLADRRRQKREAERRRRALEKRVRELTARADAAGRDAERARKAAEEAEAVAAERRREADEATAELA